MECAHAVACGGNPLVAGSIFMCVRVGVRARATRIKPSLGPLGMTSCAVWSSADVPGGSWCAPVAVQVRTNCQRSSDTDLVHVLGCESCQIAVFIGVRQTDRRSEVVGSCSLHRVAAEHPTGVCTVSNG